MTTPSLGPPTPRVAASSTCVRPAARHMEARSITFDTTLE
jgi:hypothetical protein